eukprot:1158888-Pelagomonas_calceolata.AAC.4
MGVGANSTSNLCFRMLLTGDAYASKHSRNRPSVFEKMMTEQNRLRPWMSIRALIMEFLEHPSTPDHPHLISAFFLFTHNSKPLKETAHTHTCCTWHVSTQTPTSTPFLTHCPDLQSHSLLLLVYLSTSSLPQKTTIEGIQEQHMECDAP